MIKLSYSSLNNIMNGHEWLNKQMGIPVPDYHFLKEGKDGHETIQAHVSGKKKSELLKGIEIKFPVVEERDFDPRCKFSFNVTGKGDGYEIFGYIDGLDKKNKRFLEIKTSSTPWSMTKFRDSMQRKLYGLALLDFKESILITGQRDQSRWEKEPPKIYSVPITERDREDAKAWIAKAISKLESGDFSGGLDENGKCTGCFWNMARYPGLANCHFR